MSVRTNRSRWILAVSFALFLMASPFSFAYSADSPSGEILFEGSFDIRDLSWTQDTVGNPLPLLAGTRSLEQPDLPRLPVKDLLLLVPAGRSVASIEVEVLASHREALPGILAKAGPLVTDAGEEIYANSLGESDGAFPQTWSRFGGDHTWRGYRLASVSVYPVRRITTDKGPMLEFLDSYALRVTYDDLGASADEVVQRQRLVPGEAEGNLSVLQKLVANPGAVQGYRRENGQAVAKAGGGFEPSKTPSLSGSPVSYLIITNDAMAPAFQILADHKTAQGIPTIVATRETIAANFRNGADIQETIRMFIKDAYSKWGIEYVLLGGDTDILPPRYVKNSFYPVNGYTSIPVDLYFACLDGAWNGNMNSEYGEPAVGMNPGDSVDFAEEVYLGRATVSSPAQATVFVNKVISYESTSAGSQWTNRALFAAEVLFPSDFHIQNYIILDGAQFADQQVNDHIIPCTDMEYVRMYETDDLFPREAPLTRAALIDTLNTGRYGIVNQIGHGYYFNMSVGDANFMTTDADNLTNGDHLFMIYALNCASAAFDNSCLMERFVQNPNGGSICSLGSARAAFPNNSNNYQQEFFRILYCEPENRVGKVMALSRLPFIGETGQNYVDRWTFENYTLLGDPSLPIWTGVPAALDLAGPGSLDPGSQIVNLTVTSGGNPVPGAAVNIAMGNDAEAFGITDGAGQVALDFLPIGTGTAVVTITGNNLALTTANIPVTSVDPYLSIYDMGVTDDGSDGTTGNDNGIVESGETVALEATLEETGGGSAGAVTSTLTSADTRVTILDGNASFPGVGPGGFTTASDIFMVTFADTIPDGAAVTFLLDVANGGDHYQSEWTVVVKTPEIEPVKLDWNDTAGNGNGIVENGELLALDLALKNYGAGRADMVQGYLRADHGNVILNDTTATWTGLELLDEAYGSASFALSVVDTSLPFDIRIDLVDNYGRMVSIPVQISRPEPPIDIFTDTSLGADVIGLVWEPPAGVGVLGYNVFRSLAPGGPFLQVNVDLVRGTSYYRDENLDQLTRYYYKIASVDSSYIVSAQSGLVEQATAPAERMGFPVGFVDETSSPLAVGDVDGDGDREIVLASTQVYVWHHDGLELLDGDGDSQTLGNFTDFDIGTQLQPAAVALYPLDGVPGAEMIVTERSPGTMIHIFTKDGNELAGWPQSTGGVTGSKWNWAAPSVGDIDGDGDPEIVVATLNGMIWAWHHDGTEVRDGDGNPGTNGPFYFRPGAEYEWSRSGTALYDLDDDGAKDVIFGTKNDNSGLKRLMAVKYDGTDVAGFPYTAVGPIGCTPAVGDLDNDGQVEIVFWGGWDYVFAVRADGTDYPGFPVHVSYDATLNWISDPSLGDLDGDGMLEIVYAPNRTGLDSRIYALDTDHVGGTSGDILAGFPISLPGSSEGSPMIGDIDGDTVPDIVHGIGGGDESAPYNLYAYHTDGSEVAGFPITLTGPLMPPVVITDLDFDQDVDIVFGGWDFKVHVWDMPFAYDRNYIPWPTYQGNMQRDGVFMPLSLVPVPDGNEVPATQFVVQVPYPNPFNPSTSVRLHIPRDGDLELGIYDLQGRRLRTLHQGGISSGWHTLVWDGKDDAGKGQASGVYFMRAMSGGETSIQKMTLVK